MALLTVNERKAIFKELGLGSYNKTNIKAFQKKYMLRASDVDGIYGTNTDNTLRTVYYTKKYAKNFSPKEFQCECGGKYCCGYPSYMKPAELIHIQAIRDHYGKPITITSGLRCKTWNKKCGGSIQNSLHMSGLALDFYQLGVTNTLANRKASIKWIKKQVNHHYTYGNGINSYGNGISAPYMGNALHTDCYDNVKPTHPKWVEPEKEPTLPSEPKGSYRVIDVSDWQSQIDWAKVKKAGVVGAIIRYADGNTLDKRFAENMKNAKANGIHIGSYIFSRAKTKAEAEKEAERLFNACKEYEPDMPLYIDLEVASLSKYANTVAQAFLIKMKALGGKGGVYANLNWWNNYLKDTAENYSASPFWIAQYNDTMDYKPASKMGMWQYSSSGKVSGISGKVDMDHCYVAYWDIIKAERIMDACKTQAEWMKDSKYKWQANPTVEKSKAYGTCVTYVACVLQRLGYLAPGKCIWHNKEGKALGTTDRMEVIYPNGKTLSQLKGELKAGDIVMDGDKTNLESGSHIFIVTGKWSGSKPIIWDNHSAQSKGGKSYTYSRDRNVIAIVRLK